MVYNSLNHASSFNNPCATTLTPRIYVACLASYTNGILYGAWIALDQPLEDVLEQIRRLLDKSPMPGAEEIAVHNFEGFGSLSIGEYESITMIHDQAEFIIEHGALGAELLAHYGGNLEDAEKTLEDYYMGEHESELAYATDLFDELYMHDIPESAQYYVDYQKFQRDIFINDYFSLEVNGKCHVFVYH